MFSVKVKYKNSPVTCTIQSNNRNMNSINYCSFTYFFNL